MRILTCPRQLQRLEDALRRSLPASLPVLGAVMTVARGNPAAHQVLVDSWPDFACRPHPPELADPGDFYANQLTAFYREEGAWRAVLGNPEAVDWSRAFQMQGERGGEPCAVNEVAAAKGLRVKVYRYRADAEIPAGLRLAPLSPSHVPLLNATWSFGGTGRSRRFLEGLVRALPSACILDPRRAPALLEPGGPPGLPEPRLHRAPGSGDVGWPWWHFGTGSPSVKAQWCWWGRGVALVAVGL
uniref:Glycine N-acyltransferase-like protein n=1 Tax=Anas platyrhynchos TaxID=8839 RepID=A0A8B9QX19_ANAPL